MKALLFIVLAAGCAAATGPKRPDESHRVSVNRTAPLEIEDARNANQGDVMRRQPRCAGEVEWR